MNARSCVAEFVGTFLLVVFACGTAVLGGGIFGGALGVAFGFGLTLAVLAYALGPVSGCHVNPAVTLGMLVTGKVKIPQAVGYWVAQFAGALAGAAIVLTVAQGMPSKDIRDEAKPPTVSVTDVMAKRAAATKAEAPKADEAKAGDKPACGYDATVEGLASNGYGLRSPGGYSMGAGFIIEVLATFILVFTVLMTTDSRHGAGGLAGLIIGLSLFIGHLLAINVTNASINPARSFGPAVFAGGEALSQLWMFIVAPLAGAVVAAVLYLFLRGPAPKTGAAAEGR